MKTHRARFALLGMCSLFIALPAWGQSGDGGAKSAAAAAEQLSFYLMDGSIISGSPGLKEIVVETEFGSLKVPVARIVSLTPGLDSHTDFQKKIADLVEKLGATDAAARDNAQRELVRMGPSLRSELQRYQNAGDPEQRLRIAAILEEFNSSADEADAEAASAPNIIRLDAVETPDFTIVGRIVPRSFEVASSYGTLNVRLGDIRRAARATGKEKEEMQKTISVDGTNMVQMKFKESGLRVERGDKITIKADGTLILTPWGGEAQSTPDGAANYGWYIPNQIPMGALVGKIGKNGPVLKIGSSTSFTAEQSGELQFAVAMHQSYINNPFPGKYNVKIKIKPKAAPTPAP